MRKWQVPELGNPIDVLEMVEAEPAEPGPGQVSVDVAAVGLAFPDVLQCRGEYQIKPPLPFSPGGECSGTVTAIGEGVERIKVGERILAMGGGLMESAITNEAQTFAIPDSFSFEAAAAIPINYGTTWFALHTRAHLQAGETLLVTGAAGGTGSAAIELGKAAGARVIAVAGGELKCGHAKAMGADVVIDHTQHDSFVDAVREASGGGVDVAYDPVGGDVFQQARRCMAWDGRLLVIGFVAGIPEIATNHILLKNYSVVGVHWGASLGRDPESLGHQINSVLDLAADGRINPLLFPPVGFDEAAQTLQDLADRKVYGKAVVTV